MSSKLEYISKRKLEFPSVTLCNFNFFRKSYVDDEDNPGYQLALNLLNEVTETTVREQIIIGWD